MACLDLYLTLSRCVFVLLFTAQHSLFALRVVVGGGEFTLRSVSSWLHQKQPNSVNDKHTRRHTPKEGHVQRRSLGNQFPVEFKDYERLSEQNGRTNPALGAQALASSTKLQIKVDYRLKNVT